MRCEHCGGRLRRIHRTFLERFAYLAIYRCRQCEEEHYVPRHYRLHFGHHARCPHCGTYRLTRLRERDQIDSMQRGLLNLVERLSGGKLYHCRYCRLQFYDRRKLGLESPPLAAEAQSGAAAEAQSGAEVQPPQPLEH